MTDEKRLNKGRNRRITVEVTPALYARITAAKLFTGSSITALATEAFEMLTGHYAEERRRSRLPAAE